jgi:hypothetical protein
MWMRHAAALVVGFATFSACAGNKATPTPTPELSAFGGDETVKLDVNNHNWLDVVIYVVHSGQRTRVATVVATGSASVVVPNHALRNSGGQIRLLAHAIGNPQTFLSETIVARPGMTIDWTLESDLKRSSLAVW